MKKTLLMIMALCLAVGAFAFPKSLYIKKGDTYSRYNFGVAGNLNFSNGGRTLSITGYNEVINLDNVDYITFNAPIQDNALTPSAQKEKMLTIGEAINARINMRENGDVINMFHFFLDHLNVNGDRICPPCEFEVPEEYWNVHDLKKAPAHSKIMKALKMMTNLNPAGAPALQKAVVDLYKIEDYLGIYTANYETEMWEKTADASYLEIRFTPPTGTAVRYSLRLTPSTDYTQWDTKDANVRFPRTMEIALFKDRTELGKLTLSTSLQQNKQIDLAINGKVGTAGVSTTIKIVDNGIDHHTTVTNNDEYFTEINQHIDGKNLVNYDEMFDAISEAGSHSHDEQGNCIVGDPTKLLAHFIRANLSVDVMHLIQAEGKVANPSHIYEIIGDEHDEDYPDYFEHNGYTFHTYGPSSLLSGDHTVLYHRSNDDPEDYKTYANALNDYSDVTFYYDGTKTIQGFLGFDVDIEKEEWNCGWEFVIIDGNLVPVENSGEAGYRINAQKTNNGEWESFTLAALGLSEEDIIRPAMEVQIYCDVMPLLFFPDMTSFAFDDYFNEVSFKNLINDYNDIIDTYYEITGQERDKDNNY